MNTCYQIEQRLLDLALRLGHGQPNELIHPRQAEIPEWTGADVRITSDFLWEPKGFADEHDLLVRTQHARPLTWLFFELRDAFEGHLDAGNKYGFYGALAQAALGHLARHQPESEDARPLLKSILGEAFQSLDVLRRDGSLPQQPAIVLHSKNREGHQFRADMETNESCT